MKLFQPFLNYLYLESIIGLFLLLIALQLKWIRPRHIHAVAEFLIVNMTILFLPAGVGIMERWNAISANIVPIILIIMGALVLNIVVIAVVVVYIKKHFEGDYEEVNHELIFLTHPCLV